MGAARQGTIELVMSPAMLDRLRQVLAYAKLGFSLESADRVSREIMEWVRCWVPDPHPVPSGELLCPDPEDDHVLRVAVAGRADALVSGDADLLQRLTPLGNELVAKANLQIVTASGFDGET